MTFVMKGGSTVHMGLAPTALLNADGTKYDGTVQLDHRKREDFYPEESRAVQLLRYSSIPLISSGRLRALLGL